MTAAWGVAEPPLRAAARGTGHDQCVMGDGVVRPAS